MKMIDTFGKIADLCSTHDIFIEFNSWGLTIKKYFNWCGKPYNFNQAYTYFEIARYENLEDLVLDFERQLELKIDEYICQQYSEEREDNENETYRNGL